MTRDIQAVESYCSPEKQAYNCCSHCLWSPAGHVKSPLKATVEQERLHVTA